MRPNADLPDYGTPFYLFGNARPPAARSLTELVAGDLLSPCEARHLLVMAKSDVSLAIVAPEASAGKTTLLAALLPHLPARERYFLRGSYETFAFARSASWRPREAVMIANEISDFLPVYLPGHLCQGAFRLVSQGARLWATAHANGLHDLRSRWRGWPATAPLAVVTIHGCRPRLSIELSGRARPDKAWTEA